MTTDQILSAIGSTEPSTFSEFCRELKDCPDRGDTAGWREVFALLAQCERDKLVIIERNGRSIDTMILTDAGADQIRDMLDRERGLFQRII